MLRLALPLLLRLASALERQLHRRERGWLVLRRARFVGLDRLALLSARASRLAAWTAAGSTARGAPRRTARGTSIAATFGGTAGGSPSPAALACAPFGAALAGNTIGACHL